jgi:hypothetical protein
MMQHLDDARHTARDLPDSHTPEVTWKVSTGKKGRPKQQIDPVWLAQMTTLRNKSGIAPLLSCSARTLRRRELEYRLATPGQHVARRVELPDGGVQVVYSGTQRSTCDLTDREIDTIVSSHLETFPNFGRSMMAGSLRVEGYSIPRRRVRESYD